MSKAYVVIERGFDEYLPISATWGHPNAVFMTPTKAEAYAERCNAQKYAGFVVADLCYKCLELCGLNEEELKARLNAILGKPFFVEEFDLFHKPLPHDLPLPILREIAALFKYRFFYVVAFDVIE